MPTPKNALKKQRKREARRRAISDRVQFLKVGKKRAPARPLVINDPMPTQIAEADETTATLDRIVEDHGSAFDAAIEMDLDTFEELKETARSKKKSFKKVAQDAGWTLNDPNPKAVLLPEVWSRSV